MEAWEVVRALGDELCAFFAPSLIISGGLLDCIFLETGRNRLNDTLKSFYSRTTKLTRWDSAVLTCALESCAQLNKKFLLFLFCRISMREVCEERRHA